MLHGLVITILTGRRLPLLQDTVAGMTRCDPNILRRAHVIAYLNGKDPKTKSWLSGQKWIDNLIYRSTDKPEPIGNAVSRLAALVTEVPQARYTLHLEDDWRCVAPHGGFLLDAEAILKTNPRIGQVRMRSVYETVLGHHMITGRKAPWRQATVAGVKCKVAGLHYTFNPALVRVEDLDKIYPANHENVAAKKYMRHFPLVAQLVPGAFRHTGDNKSLRAKLGRH